MSNTPFSVLLVATVAWGLAVPTAARGAGRYVEADYPPSAAAGELQVGVTTFFGYLEASPVCAA